MNMKVTNKNVAIVYSTQSFVKVNPSGKEGYKGPPTPLMLLLNKIPK